MISDQNVGTALYIFGILPGQGLLTNLSLIIDGQAVMSYQLQSNNTLDPVVTNVSFFSLPSIGYGAHSVTIQALPSVPLSRDGFFAFDYAVYTYASYVTEDVQTLNPMTFAGPTHLPRIYRLRQRHRRFPVVPLRFHHGTNHTMLQLSLLRYAVASFYSFC